MNQTRTELVEAVGPAGRRCSCLRKGLLQRCAASISLVYCRKGLPRRGRERGQLGIPNRLSGCRYPPPQPRAPCHQHEQVWSLTRSPRSPARTVLASRHERPRRSVLERREVDQGVVCPSGRTYCHVGTAVNHRRHRVHALSPRICLLYLSSGRPNSLAGERAMGESDWTSSRAGAYRQGHLCWVDKSGLQVEGIGRRICAPRRGPDQTSSTSEVLGGRERMMGGRPLSSWV